MKKEDIKQLLKETLKNGGLTIAPNGDTIKEDSGYMVSILDTEIVINLQDKTLSEVLTLFDKMLIINKNKIQTLKQAKQKLFIGFWIDNGLLYCDISICIKHKDDAIRTGKNNLQIAIYNLATQESISLFDEVYTIYKVHGEDLQPIAQVDKKEDIKRYLNTYNFNDLIITDIENIPENKNIVIIKDLIDYREI